MTQQFEQISSKGFMIHNGGILFRKILNNEYEFKSKITRNHLNSNGIAHGGYIAALADSGMGAAAYREAKVSCVTISLELKFISAVNLDCELIGHAIVRKKTKSLVFITCDLKTDKKISVTASGVWKIVKNFNKNLK